MKQHDFIPLVTFRGYDELSKIWRFGSLDIETWIEPKIISNSEPMDFFVDKDSLGIYTGKDDKNGMPIFCSVAGVEYGSDYIKIPAERIIFTIKYEDFSFKKVYKNWPDDLPLPNISSSDIDLFDCFVSGNQYEQHLKDQQCSKQK